MCIHGCGNNKLKSEKKKCNLGNPKIKICAAFEIIVCLKFIAIFLHFQLIMFTC